MTGSSISIIKVHGPSKLWCIAKMIREGWGKHWQQTDRNTSLSPAVRLKKSHTTPLSVLLNAAPSPVLEETPNGWISYTDYLY